MSVEKLVLKSREEWLAKRQSFIGGSDVSSILGLNPYMNNVELWEIKTGRHTKEDISDKPYVKYGIDAEPHIRAIYGLNHPEQTVFYEEHNIWLNDRYPYAHASLDGWIEDIEGRKGVLEIKTTTILRSMQKEDWGTVKEPKLPQSYYCQVLWYLMVTEFDFANLIALIKYSDEYSTLREYHIERSEAEEDIEYIRSRAEKFAEMVKNDIKPGLILPEI